MATLSFILLALVFTLVSSNSASDIVQIVNSGSTNTAGYVIELKRNGLVHWTVAPRRRVTVAPESSTTASPNQIRLPTARANEIFKAIDEASPFDQYQPVFCGKSVSFGTTLHLTYNGQQVSDLNCPMKDQRLVNLSKYIHDLIADLHINTFG